ncbi:hypothetical protein Mal15_12800 [Stieleria maiorica]|uniref:Transcobalamin-like C-terminal domain-containing protein n=1 Tax=Stieleria maiorica TaxID=2795974 RepID=A0A5B9M7U8_9BACT|nr:DUF4430 domain-containing protein [Stieleria maiorica]QEF97241.1 hypothetical protein Mal15_12800 [Stieleria maiorica]
MRTLFNLSTGLLITFIAVGCDRTPPPPAADANVGVVTIEIRSGDTDKQSIQVPDVADGATLESVMRMVDQVPVSVSGSGTTAFVDSIGDVQTDATQGWTFKVDGEFANQGIGQTVLHPPTTVTWSYGAFEMEAP